MKIRKWWEHLKNQPESLIFHEECSENPEPEIINPEFEEKPVVENSIETSEEFHGGRELTFSMNTASNGRKGKNESENDSENDESSENSEGLESTSKNGSGSEENREDAKTAESNETDNSENEESGESNGDAGDHDDEEQCEEDCEGCDEDYEDYEDADSESENCCDNYSGERKTNKSVDLKQVAIDRALRTAFQRFIEKIAEVETKYEIPNGTQKLSVKQLVKRAMSKKSLKSCYVDTYRDLVIMLVDTSGSMDWWAGILQKMTAIAMERKDIEIYEAPNGIVTRPIRSWKQLAEHYDWSDYEQFHEQFMERTKNRVIIYIGDFDGGDTPYELAVSNTVYWICNEDRYKDTSEHSWCSHSLAEYPRNCKILWAYNEMDLIKVFLGQRTEQRVGWERW